MLRKILITAALLATLAGCANLKFEWKASYKTDNLAQDLKEAAK